MTKRKKLRIQGNDSFNKILDSKGNKIMQYKPLNLICLIITALILTAGIFSFVSAQLPGEGLTISPPITELTINPGENTTQTIRLTNPTNKIVEVYPKVMNFSAKGEGGEPAFSESTDESSKFSLAKWIRITQSKIALTPEQVVEFKYEIEAPIGAEPGGHYGVVFFATEPPKSDADSSKVSIGSMIGSLVLVKVPGQITEKGFLEEFKTNKLLYLNNKINFTSRISNLGNVHFKPKGDVVIKSLSGKTIDTLSINEQNGNVLPNSTRKFENSWEKKGFLLGRFTAELGIVYGENEKTLIGKTTFWIIPLWIIILVLVLVIAIITFIFYRKFKNRKKKPRKPQFPPQNNGGDGGQIILR